MDKETFDKATRLAKQINDIIDIQNSIHNCCLGFNDKNYAVMLLPSKKEVIQDILSRHEAEIRQEIEDRYSDFKKQIEEL